MKELILQLLIRIFLGQVKEEVLDFHGILVGQGTDYIYVLIFRFRGCDALSGELRLCLYEPDAGIGWPKGGNRVAIVATVIGGSSNDMSITVQIVSPKKCLFNGVDLVRVTNCTFYMKKYLVDETNTRRFTVRYIQFMMKFDYCSLDMLAHLLTDLLPD